MIHRKSIPVISLSIFSAVVCATFAITGMFCAHAELRIDITQGNIDPMPVAIAPFEGRIQSEQDYGKSIADVIRADLEHSGLFSTIDQGVFIQKEMSLDVIPRFGDWRLIDASALVQGRTRLVADGRLQVEFRLWDVFVEQQMLGLAYYTAPDNWRRVAHIIADAIYERLTGEEGYFDTRIVYVAQRSANGACAPTDMKRNPFGKRLAIMDQDGENHKYLTNGDSLVLTPRFSPSLQEIIYMSYHNDLPRAYIYNIDTGYQEVIGDFPGMTFAPRFSSSGNGIIMSMTNKGNADLFSMSLDTRRIRRLTNHSAIDTSPSYAPDDKKIAFSSDRSGSQQIYIMDADGMNVERISFGKGRYATPVWSPRGDLIAFTKIVDGQFFIGIMNPDGTRERLLAEDFKIEGPTWASNGRVLMFYRKERTNADGTGGRTRLFSIDLTGHNEREVMTLCDASDPAWSPLIHQ